MIEPKWAGGFHIAQIASHVESVGVALGHVGVAGTKASAAFINLTVHFEARIAELKIEIQILRRTMARRLLGHDDSEQPAWVRRVHDQQIEAFGSGNGRVEQGWVNRE